MSDDVVMRFDNYYKCDHTGSLHEGEPEIIWHDSWDSTCNDRCPVCDTEIEPFDSEDL
jgi:hypothetical protein